MTQDYLGKNIPKLGFGLMRLPTIGDVTEIDIELLKQMVDEFLARGYTYFDTAYVYHGGMSEKAAKIALIDRYPRDSFQFATKLPAWAGCKTAADAEAMFWTSLERTGAGYFDYYLAHNLGGKRTKSFDDFNMWEFFAKMKEKGLIRHIGFSIHDKADVLDDILTKHPEMDFVQLQINYGDWENPEVESRKCYEIARKHNKPVVIMEPVKGGNLAAPPLPVAELLHDANPTVTPASWAIRFAASLDGLITVLSGMSSMEQMLDNLHTMDHFTPLNGEEQAVIEKARQALDLIPVIPCTDCRYCVADCPMNINIPHVFSATNLLMRYDNLRGAKTQYGFAIRNAGKASDCIACGNCEATCPQKIQIIEELKRIVSTLE